MINCFAQLYFYLFPSEIITPTLAMLSYVITHTFVMLSYLYNMVTHSLIWQALMKEYSNDIKFNLEAHFTLIGIYITISTVVFAIGGLRDIQNDIRIKEKLIRANLPPKIEDIIKYDTRRALEKYDVLYNRIINKLTKCMFYGFVGIFIGLIFEYFNYNWVYAVIITIYCYLTWNIVLTMLNFKEIYMLPKTLGLSIFSEEDYRYVEQDEKMFERLGSYSQLKKTDTLRGQKRKLKKNK